LISFDVERVLLVNFGVGGVPIRSNDKEHVIGDLFPALHESEYKNECNIFDF
jgi:hypothetical protein